MHPVGAEAEAVDGVAAGVAAPRGRGGGVGRDSRVSRQSRGSAREKRQGLKGNVRHHRLLIYEYSP